MTLASSGQAAVIRTERGLTIAGTRITLYQFMDYLEAGRSPESFRAYFPQITDEQFEAAITYIAANHAEVKAEHQIVLKQARDNQQFWEARHQKRISRRGLSPMQPEREALREKLRAQKAEHQPPA